MSDLSSAMRLSFSEFFPPRKSKLLQPNTSLPVVIKIAYLLD
jgi:hypothetical protein